MNSIIICLSLVALICCSGFAFELKSGECYQCASPALKTKWQMTGLPNRPADMIFDKNCLALTNLDTNARSKSCTSNKCMALIFQDPDDVKAKNTDYLVVRGCLNTLIGYNPTNIPNLSVSPYASTTGASCEGGEAMGFASDGSTQKVNQVMVLCPLATGTATQDACHNANGNTELKTCTTLPANSEVSCYMCKTPDSNCVGGSDGTCTGTYCFKAYETVNGKREVLKTCTYMNPWLATKCVDVNLSPYFPLRASVQVKGRQCYCSGNQCNGAARLAVSFVGPGIVIFALILKGFRE